MSSEDKIASFSKKVVESKTQVNSQDNEEWGVKIYVDLKRRKCRISKTKPEIQEEELSQDQRNKKLSEYIEKSFGWMSKQAQETKLSEIPPKESNQKKSSGVNHTVHTAESVGKALVLDSTYLVSKEEREDFTRVVRCLGEEYKSKGLEFECTGPKPPHNFLSTR